MTLVPEKKKLFETWLLGFNLSHPTQAKVKFPTPREGLTSQIPNSQGTENSKMPKVCLGTGDGKVSIWLVHNEAYQ